MPDRIIRDEILRSHRYVHLPSDTHRLLFVHLMLDADDYGNSEGTTTNLSLLMVRPVSEEVAAEWLNALANAGLVTVYEAEGKRYIHIHRFRQRLRITKAKHPRPPSTIDDYNETNKLKPNVRHASAISRHVSPEVKRSEEKRSDKTLAPAPARVAHVANRVPKPNPKPETPILEIKGTIQKLTLSPKGLKTDAEIEAERVRQLDYIAKNTPR